MRRFSKAKDLNSLTRLWHEAVEQGQFQGTVWALMTHPRTEKELQRMVYEEVHMLSHQVGASLVNDAHLLVESCTQNEGCNLKGRRILCIGGLHSLTCHYRSLVDQLNGELMHHDGGMEDSRQRL